MTSGRGAVANEVLAIRYGTWMTSMNACFADAEASGLPDEPLRMDYFFWLVRNGARTIVIDTGFRPATGARRGRTCILEPRRALARVGVDPSTVELVALTHLHYDHIGNLDLFPRAELVVDERELAHWSRPDAADDPFYGYVEKEEIAQVAAARAQGRARLATAEQELAPGVLLRRVGGHTAGQQIVTVQTQDALVVLTSDAVHFYLELERDWPFAVQHDIDEMRSAYSLLRRLQDEGAVLVAGHDPLVMQRFARVEELGVRIA